MTARAKVSGRKRAAEAILDADGAAAIAQSFKAKRTKLTTKRTYSSKMRVMMEWIRAKYPDLMEADGEHFTLPLPKDAVLGFFGHLIEPAHECDTKSIHADAAPSPPLSASCVEGYRSALVDLYRGASLEIDAGVDKELKEALDGYLKTINDLKLRGLMDINEGKRFLKWAGYDLLATKLMKLTPTAKGQNWSTGVFAWSFLVLMWSLMSRSDSVEKIMLQHIDWSEDALVIEEQGHKGDQTGAEKYGKHIYANPFEPAKCPILALGVQLFSCPERTSGRHQLFVGSDSKGRFGRALRSVIAALSDDELAMLGCRAKDIGTHSIRKGSSSYALSQVNGPTPVSVFLRMGQSLGQLKDRYIFSGEGADQLCGRMVAGLPFDSERFGVLPPHFEPTVRSELTQAYWNEIVSGFDKYPRSSHAMFPYLLASLVHHEPFLRANLSPNHPIFKARVFANNRLLGRLRDGVVLAFGTSPVSSMKATGIPPHLAIAARVKCISTELAGVRQQVEALEGHVTQRLPNSVAGRVVEVLREHFVVQGAVPVSAGDLERLRTELVAEIRSATLATRQIEPTQTTNPPPHPWVSWDWKDGQLPHAVPNQWEFPARVAVKQMWELWYFGDKSTGIRPYRMISKQHDLQKAHHMRHRRVEAVMDELERLMKDDNLLPPESGSNSVARQISGLDVAKSDSIFTSAYEVLLARLYNGPSKPRRVDELACGTAYKKLLDFRKQNPSK